MNSYSSLAAVERAFQVINIMIGKVDGVSVTEIVNQTGLSKSMVSRILITLKNSGYVEQNERTRFYKLSFDFLSIVYRHINALGLENMFYPLLERLCKKTGELIQLAAVKEDGIYFIAQVEGANPLRIASMLGHKASFHATAAGKAWLASLSDQEILDLTWKTGLKAYTNKTITNPKDLLENMKQIRENGYALADEEINQDVVAIAVPIYDALDKTRVVASVVIAAPKFKMTPSRIQELYQLCKQEINSFDTSLIKSFSLGYKPALLTETVNK